jgi:hypothetical protein
MAFTPDTPFPKTRGHVIKSKDWNDAITEVQRLDTAKVNRSGDSITGQLTVSGNVGIGLTGPQKALSVNAALNVDQANANNGAVNPGITFGSSSGEGLASKRTASGNQFGLDLYTGSAVRLSITNGGNVGIGTPIPSRRFHVDGTEMHSGGGGAGYSFGNRETTTFVEGPGSGERWVWYASGGNARLWSGSDKLAVTPGGNVGIGAISPADRLDVAGNLRILTGSNPIRFTSGWSGFPDPVNNQAEISNDTGTYKTLMIIGNKSGGLGRRVSVWDRLEVNGTLITTGDVTIAGRIGTNGFPPTPRQSGWGGGIRTWDIEVEATAWVRNGVQTGARDLAENFSSDMDLDPGDVVCMGYDEESVVLSEEPDDGLVLGVVSSRPGLLLNSDHDVDDGGTMFPVALCGRVPCKVVDETGPIERGDLLTSSSTPGHAMKASSVIMDGREIHRPGTIIGKAIGSLESGSGTIEVFVTSR